jgi:plasmid stabilization system protein ParE
VTSHRLHLDPAARSDLDDAVAWYEGQKAGLGLRLLDEAAGVLERVQRAPLQFPIVHKVVRRALLRRFPYAIFFVVESTSISVLAITHLRRDPAAWQSRA